jgi:hypothetical protein
MPLHDWTRVSAGVFHDFHGSWIVELKKALNGGLLPSGYYALSEQLAGEVGPDILALETRNVADDGSDSSLNGATAVKEKPPKVHFTAVANETEVYALKRRTLVIRHSSGDRVVALMEILSPGNKNRRTALERFVQKAVSVLQAGHHLLLIDLHPPGRHDPDGIHGAVWAEFDPVSYNRPSDRPLTLASYSAGTLPRAYVEPIAVGSTLLPMPLFLDEDWYINVPLEATYCEAYASVPERWRRVIEGSEGSSVGG